LWGTIQQREILQTLRGTKGVRLYKRSDKGFTAQRKGVFVHNEDILGVRDKRGEYS